MVLAAPRSVPCTPVYRQLVQTAALEKQVAPARAVP